MLAELTPTQFNEWLAAYNAGLLRDQWETTGLLAAEIHNGLRLVRATLSGKAPSKEEMRSPLDYDPTRITRQSNGTNQKSIEDYEAKVRARHG